MLFNTLNTLKKNILCCSCYLDLFFIDITLSLEIVNTVTDKAICLFANLFFDSAMVETAITVDIFEF